MGPRFDYQKAAQEPLRAMFALEKYLNGCGGGVPDAVFEEARQHFSEKELADLTWVAAAINTWNRIAISSRAVPGNYHPAKKPE